MQKLQTVAFSFDEEETLTLVDVAARTRKGFDVERVTKRFYDQFKKEHAGIQAADLICSGFLFPMAVYAYCQGHVTNLHVHLQYYRIRDRCGARLKAIQFRYQDANQWWRGGITVSDGIGHQRGSVLFGP